MGKYMDPQLAETYESLHPIGTSDLKATHDHYLSQLQGKRLVGIYDRLIFKLAPDVTNFSEFQEFENQYRTGMLVSHKFVAIPPEIFDANRTS